MDHIRYASSCHDGKMRVLANLLKPGSQCARAQRLVQSELMHQGDGARLALEPAAEQFQSNLDGDRRRYESRSVIWFIFIDCQYIP